MFFRSGSKVLAAQGFKPQSSSLMKMPRYLTDGRFEVTGVTSTVRLFCFLMGVSIHQYHGLTPMAREMESRP